MLSHYHRHVINTLTWVLALAAPALAVAAATNPTQPVNPIRPGLIPQPYRVCDDLTALTRRIPYLYRKPFNKTINAHSVMQPENVYFKDPKTGHEIVGLTRELCQDIASPDLGRPVWTCDGRHILFMGDRGFRNVNGRIEKDNWPGHKYLMNADYTNQRAMWVKFVPPLKGRWGPITSAAGMPGKFNILDPTNPRLAYYAAGDKLWQVTLHFHGYSTARVIYHFPNSHPKIIQDISPTRRLLIQDANVRRGKNGAIAYMPLIYLIDLNKKAGQAGFVYHHPMDYGLPTVRDNHGRVVHAADNDYHLHALQFTRPDTIGWNYGPMTAVGEYLDWSLNISHGLNGTPVHGPVRATASRNRWGQYESHGTGMLYNVYFAGQPVDSHGRWLPGGPWGWGLYVRNLAHLNQPPRFILKAPGGHVAGGNCQAPDIWVAYVSEGWKLPYSDALVWGTVTGGAHILCWTHSWTRGFLEGAPDHYTRWVDNAKTHNWRPYSSIPRPVLSPDGTKCWFHSSMLEPAENWVGSYVVVIRHPQPPVDLTAAAASPGLSLDWKPAALHNETRGYLVWRAGPAGKPFVQLTPTAIPQTTYTDTGARSGNTYTYAVTSEEWSTLESAATSNCVRVTLTAGGMAAHRRPSLRHWDTTPPPPVRGFTVARVPGTSGQYLLRWRKDSAADLRYYDIYFSTRHKPGVNQSHLIVSPPAQATRYLDWSAPPGAKHVYYAITAVDLQGNVSAPVYGRVHP